MNINKAVSALRLKISQYDDDTILQDEALYEIIIANAAIVISRYSDKGFKLSDFLFTTYGVKLQMVDSDFFPCETLDRCRLLESVFNIPTPLVARNRIQFKVNWNGTELPRYNSANEYDDIKKSVPSWEIANQKLRIRNIKTLKGIEVKGIWYNEMEWFDKKYCPDTETVECFNLDEIIIPALSDGKMFEMCMSLCLQSLGLNLQKIQQGENQNQAH
jgi:hypothetical protein